MLHLSGLLLFLAVSIWPLKIQAAASSPAVEIKKSQLELPDNAENVRWIRVSIGKPESTVNLSVQMPFYVTDGNGQMLFKSEKPLSTEIKANSRGIQFGSQTFYPVPVIIQSEGPLQVGSRAYRNAVEFWPRPNNQVGVVNELDIEDYLKGVLPWEANPEWDLEALKAQAVASRTYAIFNMLEKESEQYGVHDDVKSQVYAGKTIEKPQTNNAVNETEGEILVYRGKIFPAFFHSTSGGATTRAEYIWDIEPHPSLSGVVTEFSRGSKHYRWQESFSEQQILKVLHEKGYDLQSVDQFSLEDIDQSGRARFFGFTSGKKLIKIRSNDFRIWMDPGKFKSTKIESIQKDGSVFHLKGYGWGHGVGMCQYSMKRLAELGYTYRQILQYFYPGSDVIKFYSSE
ncbi:MAG: SpoIID/LytB domain-containing protein [Candidatus Omnitrophica bacterium]|nr:SpoIID/LytB domain-containing protein [Candidatus Omnitrophota bacterium]